MRYGVFVDCDRILSRSWWIAPPYKRSSFSSESIRGMEYAFFVRIVEISSLKVKLQGGRANALEFSRGGLAMPT